MSNYFVCAVRPAVAGTVRAWIAHHADQSEVCESSQPDGTTTFIVSRDVSRWTRAGAFFKGSAFMERGAILSVDGLAEFRKQGDQVAHLDSAAGEFITFDVSSGDFEIYRDFFALARLVYTNVMEGYAFSDSLILIREFRSLLGYPVAVNREVVLARTLLNLFAYQQLSPDTVYEQVSYLPAGYRARVSNRRFEPVPIVIPSASRGQRYVDLLYSAATSMVSQMVALRAGGSRSFNLNLSGGMDSRIVLAAALFGGVPLSCTSANGGGNRGEDYEIAGELASRNGVPFQVAFPAEPDGPGEDQLTGWGASLAGLYDGFGVSRVLPRYPSVTSMTGLGGELGRGTSWGWAAIGRVVDRAIRPDDIHTSPSQVAAFEAQLAKGVDALTAATSGRSEIDGHYFAYRSGLHAGAGHLLHNMNSLNPLANLPWFLLGETPERRYSPDQVALDALVLLDPRLAADRFEGNRGFTASDIGNRVAALKAVGRPSADPRVYGEVTIEGWGPSRFAMSIAREAGFSGEFSSDRIQSVADKHLPLLDDAEFEGIYGRLVKNSMWMIRKSAGSAFAAGPSTAKVAMLPLIAPPR